MTKILRILPVFVIAFLLPGCAIKHMAINMAGNALAKSGTTFTSDDDPELVGAAIPFGLKLYESLLAENPRHRGLLFAAASGFTSYTYAFVQQDADEMEERDFARATALRVRARRLYLRARDYGLRGLEVSHKGFVEALRQDPVMAARKAIKKDVDLLYWTAAAWGAAISLSKDNPDLISDQPTVEALIDRALELNEGFDSGAIHTFLISYESARNGAAADPADRARKHFDRAMELSGGFQAAPLVSFVEAVSIQKQNRKEFENLLGRAVAIDANAKPEVRLANLVMQRRARWLLSRADDLFLEGGTQ